MKSPLTHLARFTAATLLSLTFAQTAAASLAPGNYILPDGALFYFNGTDAACRWKDQDTFQNMQANHGRSADVTRISYQDLHGVRLDGWCEGISGPQHLGKTVTHPNARSSEFCRYFVATDRLTPKAHDAGFSNVTLWIMDENRHTGLGDLWSWEDTHRVSRGLETNEKQVRRAVSVRSDWFELMPKGAMDPVFSFYAFTRWQSYLVSKFAYTNLNAANFESGWRATTEVARFQGTQEINTRIASTSSYFLEYRVLRLCAPKLEPLYPEPDLVIPARVKPAAKK